jgi:beta-glucanase (GH16 family)/hypothetical membrane protein
MHKPEWFITRLPLLLIAAALQFFVVEYLVSGSWHGDYSYAQNFISDLGLPYCGPTGSAPCSTSSALMNVSFVVLGCALLLAAESVNPMGTTPSVGRVFMAMAGIGGVVVGMVPSNSDWPLHSFGASLVMIFGGLSALTVGLLTVRRRRRVAIPTAVLGVIALAGYVCYVQSWQFGLGPGGIERVSAYAVILGFVGSMVLATQRRPATPEAGTGPSAEVSTEVEASRRNGSSRGTVTVAILMATLVLAGGFDAAPARATPVASANQLYDDFGGPEGSRPNPGTWSYDLGGGGWGNNEVQTYVDRAENVSVDGQGHLVVAAVRQPNGGYTSARLTTRGKLAFTYGRAEARIKVPSGQGLHPAFWLLGTDIDDVGWPQSGEVDVMETINDATNGSCALHGPSKTGSQWQLGGGGSTGSPLSDDFHTYWVQRSPGSISMGIDDRTTCAFTAAQLAPGNLWVFDKPFFLLLNVAVGGNYSGPTDAGTPSRAAMLVDWVRVTPS